MKIYTFSANNEQGSMRRGENWSPEKLFYDYVHKRIKIRRDSRDSVTWCD